MSKNAKLKRGVDIAMAVILIPICAPIFILLAAVIRVQMGSPIFFSQDRAGKGARIFRIFKFRSMKNMCPGENMLASDHARLTRLGTFLRKTSLDELPELWNILQGNMSFVGPRPLLPEYLPRYNTRQSKRHEVLPGLTGWAQVNGRNALDWETRLELDVWYVEHQSLKLDFTILARTIRTVLSSEGVNAKGQATMNEFKGTP